MTASVAAPPAVAADLVLVRMALPAKQPPAPKVIRKDVGRLLHGGDMTVEEFSAIRGDLATSEHITVSSRGSVRITDAGRARALAFLGVNEFAPRTTWQTVQAKHLFPKAAGLSAEAAGRLDGAEKLRALVLKRKYDLPTGSGTSVESALEALACRELGFPEETTLAGVKRKVLSRLLKTDERLTTEQLARQLPWFDTGLTTGDATDVRRTVVRAWLAARAAGAADEPAEFDLAAFAETVKALARVSPPEDRFHENKVFIAAVWRASQREDGFPRMSLDVFKTRLVEANRDGLLRLSRADEVQTMPADLVRDSEISVLNATFHFVLIEGDRP